jgi:hypothetical protein
MERFLMEIRDQTTRNFDEDNMYAVDVWVEDQLLSLAMNTLVYPHTMDANILTASDFHDFISKTPGQYYLLFSSKTFALQLQSTPYLPFILSLDCRLRIVGTLFSIFKIFTIGELSVGEKQALNSAILDTIEFSGYENEISMDSEENQCQNPIKMEEFFLNYENFRDLWIFFAFAGFLASVFHFLSSIYNKKCRRKTKIEIFDFRWTRVR